MTPSLPPPKKSEGPLLWGPESASPLVSEAAHFERWRRRTWQLHLSVALSHLYALALFLGHAWAGYAPLSAVLWYGLWIAVGMAFITWAYASGWSQKRRDPGLFLEHQLMSISGVLGLLVVAPQVAFQALVMLLVFSADGFLARRRTSFWLTWGLTLALVAVVICWRGPQMRMVTDTLAGQLLTAAVMLGAVVRCSMLVTYFRGMQYRLSASNQKLAAALAHIEQLARYDELTGVANRRGVLERLHLALEGVQRHGTPLSIALLDIDHFKSINDQYGHGCGDAVLRAFGSLLSTEMRAIDVAGRYGGEEFLLVLPETDIPQALVLLERLRQRTQDMPWDRLVDQPVTVTCTVGATQYQPGEPVEAAIARADAAMYSGKALGRNRVIIDGMGS